MKVYLAGPIHGCGDAVATQWRKEAKAFLPGVRFLDPLVRDYRGREPGYEEEIVLGDLDDISRSDYVLAMCTAPSWGTGMELSYAHLFGVPSIAVTGFTTLSPWLKYHTTTRFMRLEEALFYLRGCCT